MKPEDFEKHLGRQPMRPVPREWRAEILSAARRASTQQPELCARRDSWGTVLSSFNARLAKFLWPHPAAWAGLAAAWVVILGINLLTRDAAVGVARRAASPSPEVFMAFQEQQRLLSELIGAREMPVADRSEPTPPRPRSERRSGVGMA